jgi:hypothetical protein
MTESDEHEEPKSTDQAASAEPKLSEGLKRFMVGLASDVGKLTDFMLDQKKAFRDAGLSDEQQQILLSGDQTRIYAALKDLPLPPPAPPPPPAQMPTVVAALNYQGAPAAGAAAAPDAATPGMPQTPGQLPPYYVLQQPWAQGQMQPAPTYQYQPQIYYVVQWPNWPPSR